MEVWPVSTRRKWLFLPPKRRLGHEQSAPQQHDFLSGIVNIFLRSICRQGFFSLMEEALQPLRSRREEDPQIVVPWRIFA
jgi:hypothetical protein